MAKVVKRGVTLEERKIYVTEFDRTRLVNLLNVAGSWNDKDIDDLTRLENELEQVHVVSSQAIPSDVVTMNSRARVRDLDSSEEMVFTLVFPAEADYIRGRLSVLAPIGTALLGYRAGDTVELQVPSGVRRLKIEQILYQPEAAGDYHV